MYATSSACCAAWACGSSPTFRRVPILPPSSSCIGRRRQAARNILDSSQPYEAHDTEARIAELTAGGVPRDVAEDAAVQPLMAGLPEIALMANRHHQPLDLVAGAYFAMGAAVGIDRLRGLAARITAGEHWDRLAIRRLIDDLYAASGR